MVVSVAHADMLEWLPVYAAAIAAGEAEPFDVCATDGPYHLTSIVKRFGAEGSAPAKDRDGAFQRAGRGFMGKRWDGGDICQRPETWRAVCDCLKPGAHLVAFGGTRTFHRQTVAIEDAGFEIRDQVADLFDADPLAALFMESLSAQQRDIFARLLDAGQFTGFLAWIYGTGMPKPHNQKGDWQGWSSALKPAWEPICVARKPLSEGSIAANLAAHNVGALNIDACRIGTDEELRTGAGKLWSHYREGEASAERRYSERGGTNFAMKPGARGGDPLGRWPANVVHDGSVAVEQHFSEAPGQLAAVRPDSGGGRKTANVYGEFAANSDFTPRGDSGTAARFFYSAKAGPLDRIGSAHATVKPVDLMRWVIRLVTPPGGRVLDPFAGSGKTGIACLAEGFDCQMIELEADHVADIERQLAFLRGEGELSTIELHKARRAREAAEGLPPLGGLFEGFAA